MVEAREDARWRRTREKLTAAVLRLAAEDTVDRISMAALAAEAGLSRSTVYEHASTPREVLEEVLTAELDEYRANRLEGISPEQVATATAAVARDVVGHIERHGAVYRRGLAMDAGAGSLQSMLAAHFAGSARMLLTAHDVDPGVGGPADAEAVAELAARGVAASTVGQLSAWIALPPPRDLDLFLAVNQASLPAWWPRRE